MTYKMTRLAGTRASQNRWTAVLYSVLILASLTCEALSQQLANDQTNLLNTFATGQSGLLNTFATDLDDVNTATIVSKNLYDDSFGTGLVSSPVQSVQGQVLVSNPAQYPVSAYQTSLQQVGAQYPVSAYQTSLQQVGGIANGYASNYVQHAGAQLYPSQYGFGYQPRQYGAMYGQNPGFNANYWSGNMRNYPVQLPVHQPLVPVHKPLVPVHRPALPVHVMPPVHYPVHPAMHHGGYVRKNRGKGFLGGTGNGVVKGVLGAVLAGVVAGKVARGK